MQDNQLKGKNQLVMEFHCAKDLQVVSELVQSARNSDFTDIVMIHEHRGEPDGLVVCHMPYGPSAYFGIFNTVSLLPQSSELVSLGPSVLGL